MSYSISEETQPALTRVRLQGTLTASAVEALRRELEDSSQSLLLMDLCDLKDCENEAREPFAALQRHMAKKVKRTAYVSDTARFRGLSLWVVRIADDDHAKVVATDTQAKAWLTPLPSSAESMGRKSSIFNKIRENLRMAQKWGMDD